MSRAIPTTILRESPFLFSQAKRHLPTKPNRRTIWRWATQGKASISGVVIKLEYVTTPTGALTSFRAYQRFIRKLNS